MESDQDTSSSDENKAENTIYRLTSEQKNAIKELFSARHWDYKELNSKEDQDNNDFDPDNIEPEYVVKHSDNDPECPHCLCRPCITTQRQQWYPQAPAPPDVMNSIRRKRCYKSFWTRLFHRRVWRDVRYLARKHAALGLDAQRNRFVYHKRDIMPNCVLDLVRSWYPNPKGVRYMGHRWE